MKIVAASRKPARDREARRRGETTYSLLKSAAASNPHGGAITFLPSIDGTPIRLTHSELMSRLHRVARLFKSLGVTREECITVLAPPLADAFVAFWAAQAVAIAQPLNTMLRASDIAGLMRAARSRILVTAGPSSGAELWDKALEARRLVPGLRAVVALGDIDPGHDAVHMASRLPEDGSDLNAAPEPEDLAVIFSTGGTTGAPKLARLSHANQAFSARALANAWGFDSSTRFVNGLPLFHVGGSLLFALTPLAAGGEMLIPTAAGLRDPKVIAGHWRMVEMYKPTVIGGIPTSLSALLNVPLAGADISSVRLCATGGALLSVSLSNAFTGKFGIPIRQLYGMTESSGLIAAGRVDDHVPNGMVGPKVPGVEVAARRLLAADAIGEELAPGKSGILVARGPNLFDGYVDKNRTALTEDGWLITGDVGTVDSAGWIRVTGRAKDVIIRSGHNIDPQVIEEAAASHPQVVTSAAVGRPDSYAGEVPMLYVVLRDKALDVIGDLRAHLDRTVPEAPANPKTIVVLDALPMTAVGKIDKNALSRDASRRAATDALTQIPGISAWPVEITTTSTTGSRILVEVCFVAPIEMYTQLSTAVHSYLSGYPFDVLVSFRENPSNSCA